MATAAPAKEEDDEVRLVRHSPSKPSLAPSLPPSLLITPSLPPSLIQIGLGMLPLALLSLASFTADAFHVSGGGLRRARTGRSPAAAAAPPPPPPLHSPSPPFSTTTLTARLLQRHLFPSSPSSFLSFSSTSSSSSPLTRLWATPGGSPPSLEDEEEEKRRRQRRRNSNSSSSSSSSNDDDDDEEEDKDEDGGKEDGKQRKSGSSRSSSSKTENKKKRKAAVSSTARSGAKGYSRDALLGVLGVTLLTGLAIGTSKPDLTSFLPSSTPSSLPFSSSTTGASPLAGASTSSFLGDRANRKGYLGWRRLSEVENRAKDQNKAQKTYPVRFVTYLTRFLVNFDEDDKALWAKLAKDVPFTYKEAQVEETRRRQFAAIADSAEIGLYDYQGPEGVQRLFELLKDRYGQTSEARRQLAILFSFLEESQPVQGIARMLIDTDNARVAAFRLITGGDGYTSPTPPKVSNDRPLPPSLC